MGCSSDEDEAKKIKKKNKKEKGSIINLNEFNQALSIYSSQSTKLPLGINPLTPIGEVIRISFDDIGFAAPLKTDIASISTATAQILYNRHGIQFYKDLCDIVKYRSCFVFNSATNDGNDEGLSLLYDVAFSEIPLLSFALLMHAIMDTRRKNYSFLSDASADCTIQQLLMSTDSRISEDQHQRMVANGIFSFHYLKVILECTPKSAWINRGLSLMLLVTLQEIYWRKTLPNRQTNTASEENEKSKNICSTASLQPHPTDPENKILIHDPKSGADYEVSRFCPHKNADFLKGGQVIYKEGVVGPIVVCPKHEWQFSLSQNGKCIFPDKEKAKSCNLKINKLLSW